MKKILFIIPSLAGGGAERVSVLLFRHLDHTRFEPVVVVFGSTNDYQGEVPADLRIISLKRRGRLGFFRLVLSLSRVLRKETPSVICSFLTYTNYLSVLAREVSRYKAPLFLTEHSNLTILLKHARFSSFKRILVQKLHPRADGIIAVSNGVKDDLVVNFGISSEKCEVIYNPVEFDKIQIIAKEEIDHPGFRKGIPIIVACGRLTAQKNYTMLLRVIKLVLQESPVQLFILGDGDDRFKLETYANELCVNKNVTFLGFQQNPFKFIAKATVFVLSSSWEGFGNVLIEAMACGVPVISTNCPSGPNEIIKDSTNGLLVPTGDEIAFKDAILRLLNDVSLRKRLADGGKKRAEDFRVEKIVKEYERLFDRGSGIE